MPRVARSASKAAKEERMAGEMRKFKMGELHSGSPDGPLVTNRDQAIAISLQESGQSKKKRKKAGSIPGLRGKKR